MARLFDKHRIAEELSEDVAVNRKAPRLFDALGIRDDWSVRPKRTVPVHETARRAGRQDGLEGHRDHAGRWPSGVYGHADYELGWAEGEAEAPKFHLGGFE